MHKQLSKVAAQHTMPTTRFRWPVSAIFFGVLGLIALAVGILAMTGLLRTVHPLLNGDGGLALVVSGIALILSGAFPLGLALLAASALSTCLRSVMSRAMPNRPMILPSQSNNGPLVVRKIRSPSTMDNFSSKVTGSSPSIPSRSTAMMWAACSGG